jgi:hypothetical protein
MEPDNETLQVDRITAVFAKTATQEAEALVLFEQRFDKQFPMPETPNVQMMAPGPTKLMEDLGVAKGYASNVIKAWKADRRIPTPSQDAPDVPSQ